MSSTGRPIKESKKELKKLFINIDANDYDRLVVMADSLNISVGAIIRIIIKGKMEKISDAEDFKLQDLLG